MQLTVNQRVGGSIPPWGARFCPGDGIGIRVGLRSQILGVRVSPGAPSISKDMRGSYSGNTLAFQAKARSSILLPRSIFLPGCVERLYVSFARRAMTVRVCHQVPYTRNVAQPG